MGRARGRLHAIADAGFAAAMGGSRRGPSELDTLLARAPSPRAREELAALIQKPGFAETAEALNILNAHRKVIDQRPLLGELADNLSLRAVNEASGTWSSSAKQFLAIAGVRGPKSDQLFVDGSDKLHICAAGRAYRTRDDLATACGITLGRSDIYRANRGAWNNLAAEKMTRCEPCEKAAAAASPDAAESARNWPVISEADSADVRADAAGKVREDLTATLAEGKDLTEDVLADSATAVWPRTLLEYAARRTRESGVEVLAAALGEDHWRTLSSQVETDRLDPAELWDEEEWRDYLLPYLPTSPVPLPREEQAARVARARDSLYADLCADLGIKRRR